MGQPPLHLIIGNYNTSSWSLRAWLTLRLARLAFTETRIPLRRQETAERIAQHSPSGKLPVLLAESVPIWDTLAIAEFIAEVEPAIWPDDPVRRAEARSISAEMHSGFADLRRFMPMDITGRFSPPGILPRGLAADIARIKAIWQHCRERFAEDGPFLFGDFSVADAMMAPVATRFVTHGVPVEGLVEDYVDSVMSWPDMVIWCDAAAAEQDEAEAQGGLDVVSRAREGRVPGVDAQTAPAAAPPIVEPEPALPAPAAWPAGELPVDAEPPRAEVEPEWAVEAALAFEPAPAELVELEVPEVLDTEAGGPAAASVPDEVAPPEEPSPPPFLPPEVLEPPRRGLDWLRRAVVAEQTGAGQTGAIPPAPADLPLRRAGGGFAARPAPAEPTGRPLLDARPLSRRAGDDEPLPGDQATPRPRPGGPAIKPIGGGILRRR